MGLDDIPWFVMFILEEVIIGSVEGLIYTYVQNDVNTVNGTAFQSVIPFLYLIYIVFLLIPVIAHFDDLKNII